MSLAPEELIDEDPRENRKLLPKPNRPFAFVTVLEEMVLINEESIENRLGIDNVIWALRQAFCTSHTSEIATPGLNAPDVDPVGPFADEPVMPLATDSKPQAHVVD